MPSTKKTSNINLNQWTGNEYVKRQDFCDDNLIIDTEIKKNSDKIGNLPNLKTTKKDNLVNAINEVQELAAKGYTFNEFTLLSGSWSGQTYSLEGSYPSSKYDIEVELSGNATKEIAKAWGKIIPVADTSSRNIIKALGTVPSINIPVRLKVVSK